jgi:hypothetical protein
MAYLGLPTFDILYHSSFLHMLCINMLQNGVGTYYVTM